MFYIICTKKITQKKKEKKSKKGWPGTGSTSKCVFFKNKTNKQKNK